MPLDEELLKKCTQAAERVIELESAAEQARTEYHAAIRRTHLAGGSYREIGAALGVSHQRISQIVTAESGGWLRRWFRSDAEPERLACSFCGRSSQKVDKLVAGPHVHICDQCIAGAEAVLKSGKAQQNPTPIKLIDSKKARCSFCRNVQKGTTVLAGNDEDRICNSCITTARDLTDNVLR